MIARMFKMEYQRNEFAYRDYLERIYAYMDAYYDAIYQYLLLCGIQEL